MCHYCQGELEEKLVSRVQAYDGRWFLIENLPALVCKQCGETYYTPDAHDLVVRIITGQTKPARTDEIAVYDAAGVA